MGEYWTLDTFFNILFSPCCTLDIMHTKCTPHYTNYIAHCTHSPEHFKQHSNNRKYIHIYIYIYISSPYSFKSLLLGFSFSEIAASTATGALTCSIKCSVMLPSYPDSSVVLKTLGGWTSLTLPSC